MKKNIIIISITAILFITGFILGSYKKNDDYLTKKTQQVHDVLIQRTNFIQTQMQEIAEELSSHSIDSIFKTHPKFESVFENQKDIFVYGYYKDSLAFWSSGNILVPFRTFDEDFVRPIVKMKNGWFKVVKYHYKDWKMLGLVLIQYDFSIKNEYLKKEFNPLFSLDEEAKIEVDSSNTSTSFKVTDEKNNYLFSLKFKKSISKKLVYETASSIFYFLAVVFFLYFIFSLKDVLFFQKFPHIYALILVIITFCIRYFSIHLQLPSILYQHPVFQPELFASSNFLPSLGDFILNGIAITFVIFGLAQIYQKRKYNPTSKIAKFIFLFIVSLFIASAGLGINYLIEKLVIDSKISFDLSNLLGLNFYSFLGFSIITFLLLNYLVISYALCRQIARTRVITLVEGIVFFLLAHLLVLAISYQIKLFYPYPFAILFLLNIFILNKNLKRKHVFNYYNLAPIIFLFAFFASISLYQLNNIKEKNYRQSLAFKLSDEQDYVAEYLFQKTVEELKSDHIIKQLLFENDYFYPNELFDRIAKKYFGGYYSRYALIISPFSQEEYLLMNDSINGIPELKEYENSIEFNGKNTTSENLYFIDNNYGSVNYIGKIEFIKQNMDLTLSKKYIYIELISKIVTQINGFPQLLLDDKITKPADLSGYSYALYKGNKLTVSGGDYTYPLSTTELLIPKLDFDFNDLNEYNHLYYKTLSGKLVIISKKNTTLQQFFSPFAYMLIYFTLILFFYILYRYLFIKDSQTFQFNFKTRIQLSILLILLVSLVVIGLGINNYVITQFNKKNKTNLQEKANSILYEFKTKLDEKKDEEIEIDYIKEVLMHLHNTFFTDINFYFSNGNLVASSRENIYTDGYLAKQMNPKAFYELSVKEQAFFMQSEKIGSFDYLSVYSVFRNNDNEVVGYLNLPYFLRQKELKEDLSSSLLSMINVFSILIAISMIVTFIIASRLTEPLTILQEKLGQIRIGRKNEVIDYKKNDEIGDLVKEYNRMISELEDSALLLAKSERESAWREMAKQVAHEVKNPLTPMKLSVQYLMKAWDDKRPDFDERLRKFKESMIEQIDTLSNIASEFSYFAKMPMAVKQEFNLVEMIENCTQFFEHNEYQSDIEFISHVDEKRCIVLADKDQLLRVFNNIIRNGMQSIPSDRIGLIQIEINETPTNYIVTFKDNGQGIPDDIKDKIFTPNFTTKSSGMGLGLAMTKTIVENLEGKIWFETELNEGTIFYIELKKLGIS